MLFRSHAIETDVALGVRPHHNRDSDDDFNYGVGGECCLRSGLGTAICVGRYIWSLDGAFCKEKLRGRENDVEKGHKLTRYNTIRECIAPALAHSRPLRAI